MCADSNLPSESHLTQLMLQHQLFPHNKTNDTQMRQIFDRVLQKKPVEEIAQHIGLHTATVRRWLKTGPPTAYLDDFTRLLSGTGQAVDRFYTKPEAARWCTDRFHQATANTGMDLRQHWFVEPSAGRRAFYDLMPSRRRIGIDIDSAAEGRGLIRADYLTWLPTPGDYVVLGNPPFGLRGHLALQFINHSAVFAAAVGFVLPQSFVSTGKGAPAKRVNKTMKKIFAAPMPTRSFVSPSGETLNINTIFAVWKKRDGSERQPPERTCDTFVKIFSLSDGGTPQSTRNQKMIGRCDVYLPSTCFEGMRAYKNFHNLPHRRGYGITALREQENIITLLTSTDWETIAFRSTNGALNLRADLIRSVITEAGYHETEQLFPPAKT